MKLYIAQTTLYKDFIIANDFNITKINELLLKINCLK